MSKLINDLNFTFSSVKSMSCGENFCIFGAGQNGGNMEFQRLTIYSDFLLLCGPWELLLLLLLLVLFFRDSVLLCHPG